MARLEAAARNEEPPPAIWPAAFSDETDEGVDQINDWLHAYYHDQPAEAILGEAREQFGRMRAAVEALSEEDLNAPRRYPWLDGTPLSAVIDGSFEHMHEEHEPELRA